LTVVPFRSETHTQHPSDVPHHVVT